MGGKYNSSIPDDSRANMPGYGWLQGILTGWHADGKIDKVKELTVYAEKNFKCSMAQLALAWAVSNPNVTTVLLGATKPTQLTENLESLKIAKRLTPKHKEEIDAILGNKPSAYQGYGADKKGRYY